ncbi:hypothetical protein D3C87_1993440 [compost metagenome]
MQVVGAMGTAVAISILTSGKDKYLAAASTPTLPNESANAITAGAQNVFWIMLLVAVIGFIVGLFVRRSNNNNGEVRSTH